MATQVHKYRTQVIIRNTGESFDVICLALSKESAINALNHSYPKANFEIKEPKEEKTVCFIKVEPICPN